jgi:RNA polymerase sigma factor (sigma-70 family)
LKKIDDDKTAIADIRKGGRKGAEYIFQQYGGRLLNLFQKSLSLTDAEEVLQETLLRFFKSVQKNQYTEQDKLFAYLAKIGSNEVIRKINDNHKQPEPQPYFQNDDDVIPSETHIEKEICYQMCVAKALNKFEKKDRHAKNCVEALTLQFKGWLIIEIAKKIGRTTNATKEFLSACRKKLKPYLRHCLDDCDKL